MKHHKPASKIAKRVYEALLLTGFSVHPEVAVPGNNKLHIDYVVKELGAGVECQGSQHLEFNSFFHSSKYDFADQKKRDEQKVELCKEAGITLIHLYEKEIMDAKSPQELLSFILSKIKDKRTETEEEEW